MSSNVYGYAGKILKVNLTDHTISEEKLDEATWRQYLGGTGIGAKYLYENVPPGTDWSNPKNVLVWASGPLSGTTVPGSGTFSVVTKGALTNGATSSQSNGFFGAYLKLSGFDAIVIQGASKNWVYLYIHDGIAEFADAEHLVGKNTWETEDAIKKEKGLTEHGASVFGIGPAGENLVRFAAIAGDRGHLAAHNGVGAVMGSKKLKAIAASRGKTAVPIKDREAFSALSKEILKEARISPGAKVYDWGTSQLYGGFMKFNVLPIKNLTTASFPDYEKFIGDNYRPRLSMDKSPCWSCQANHCHIVKVLEGPYAGYVGEEPDYEGLAAFGSLICQTDVGAAIMLSNEADRLGIDCNETGWLIAMLMECYEKGIITKKETDGLELTWGNTEVVKALMHKIAKRQGFGNTLAEGVMRAAQVIGGEAPNIGVYVNKGNTPRGHDHRAMWTELFDTTVSNVGTVETGPITVKDTFSPQEVSTAVARGKGARFFKDSLGICLLSTGTMHAMLADDPGLNRLIGVLNAATGWEFTLDEAERMGLRVANLLRVFNLRQGITSEMESPSPRYGSAPSEGRAKGISIMTNWKQMLENYYKEMGWDSKTGKPLPSTLRNLGLEHIIRDL